MATKAAKGTGGAPATTADETLRTYAPQVDKDLEEFASSRKDVGDLYRFMQYHLGYLDVTEGKFVAYHGDRGKRFRPVLCVLSHEALGGEPAAALPAGTAIELIHNFSLIHDDIMDGDEYRRNRQTVWKRWGNAHAINAGDGMHALASLSVLRLREKKLPAARVQEAFRVFTEAILALCEGQYLDMEFETQGNVDVRAYLEMAGRKTAALVACATEMGALLATDNKNTIAAFRGFGWDVGLAFQIRDDVLGLQNPENLGKGLSTDILRGKKTFPILHALGNTKDAKLVAKFQEKRITKSDIPAFVELVQKAKSVEFAMKESDRLLASGIARLEGAAPLSPARDRLLSLARYLVTRER